MMKLTTLFTFAFLFFAFGCNTNATVKEQTAENQQADPPNIIFIYVDDMGIGDPSYSHGGVVNTPNIDKLAANGKVFSNYYTTAPVCSPSRVALTTGMYHIRWNINTFLNDKKFNDKCEQSDYLDASAPTLAKSLKAAGYTTGHFGKWHMGGGRDVDHAPQIPQYGFDQFSSTWESPSPDPIITSSDWIWAPTDSVKRWNRTAYFVDRTLRFMEENKGKPCFVNLWPDDVHTPWVPNEKVQSAGSEVWDELQNLEPVLSEFDKQIGRLLSGLEEKGLADNTMIIFTSDNGPKPSFNKKRTNGLRGEKNSLYEGGILMPFIAYWPGHIDAGQVDSTSVIASIDMFPTLCEIAGANVPDNVDLNGEDISAAFFGKSVVTRENDLFFEYGRNETFMYPADSAERSLQLAVRHGDWKLFTTPDGGQTELYNLESDPKESENLAASNPDMVQALKPKLINWFKDHDKEFLKSSEAN